MAIEIDRNQLLEFEKGLNIRDIEKSSIPTTLLGYGEISAIFKIDEIPGLAFKRMPLFTSIAEAENYVKKYRDYCKSLQKAGITLPEDETIILQSDRLVILYIAQEQLPADLFCHRLLHARSDQEIELFITKIIQAIKRIWRFNKKHEPELELAIDGQISNWVLYEADGKEKLIYVDTSTPLFKRNGNEQLDPELFLKSAPSFLRWIIRWLFLGEVMNHYYNPGKVFIDLAANLYKEQRPELIPMVLDICNKDIEDDESRITEGMVKKYYKEDKMTWAVFLAFRRLDRWIRINILKKEYDFILPGKIKR